MNSEQYYERIAALKEAEDFMRVMKKWDTLSKRVGEQKDIQMVLPDLFWVAKSGVGRTHLLSLLSEYLYECGNLMEFSGRVKYFEFMLDYCPPSAPFEEIRRLLSEVMNATGFRRSFKGIISIDIEEWLGHCEEKHFITFLEYLSSNSDDWLIIFNLSGEREEEVQKLESILSMYFRFEKSYLLLPNTPDLVDYVKGKLSLYSLTLDEGAEELIAAAIEKLRQNKYFDGYKTLNILCRDLVYEVYSGETMNGQILSVADLVHFAPDSAYISRTAFRAERKLGLLNKREG